MDRLIRAPVNARVVFSITSPPPITDLHHSLIFGPDGAQLFFISVFL